MIYDKKRDRIVHENGCSEFSEEAYCKRLFEDRLESFDYCIPSTDTELYEQYYRESVTLKEDTSLELPEKDNDEDKILDRIASSKRFQWTSEEQERIEEEMEFFRRTGNLDYINRLISLIDEFKQKGIIWGVGRGSSCSSYVLYLLEVHDVDPLKYKIPFRELSKQD